MSMLFIFGKLEINELFIAKNDDENIPRRFRNMKWALRNYSNIHVVLTTGDISNSMYICMYIEDLLTRRDII